MPNYRIDITPIAAGGPVEVTGAPNEVAPEALYAFADAVVGGISPAWEAEIEGVYRTDVGTPIERPTE